MLIITKYTKFVGTMYPQRTHKQKVLMALDSTIKIRIDNDLHEALQEIANAHYEKSISQTIRSICRAECENRGLLTVKLSKTVKTSTKQQLVAGGDINIQNSNGSIQLGDKKSGRK